MEETLFLNYSPISGFAVQSYRNTGFVNYTIEGFMGDISTGIQSNLDLDKVKEELLTINICDYPQEDRGEITDILADIREAIAGY